MSQITGGLRWPLGNLLHSLAGVYHGPGDPNLAHARGDRVPVSQIYLVERVLRGYLTS